MNDGQQTKIEFSLRDYLAPAILRMAAIEHEGAVKYGHDNYKKIEFKDNVEHAIRHLLLVLISASDGGEELLKSIGENGEDHLAHAGCRIGMAMAAEKQNEQATFNALHITNPENITYNEITFCRDGIVIKTDEGKEIRIIACDKSIKE